MIECGSEPVAISVLMPVYNAEDYIQYAVESILSQSFTNFEFIIIDDGSTDNSMIILEKLADKDGRIKLFSQENKGRSFTRNKCLALACSELVVTMDSDDISLPNRLQLQYDYMLNHTDVVVVGGQVDAICMMGVDLYKSAFPLEHENVQEALLNDDGVQLCQPSTMMRKSVALSLGGYNEEYLVGEDTDLFLRMALKGKLANLPDVILKYRKHPGSSTNVSNLGLYRESLIRVSKAWSDRGLNIPSDFSHWSENLQNRTPQDDYLQWGWNALSKGEKKIANFYAKKLFFLFSYDVSVLRFYFCVVRGH
jgi:glycosyltransferase involved in cell wall biosynthesis